MAYPLPVLIHVAAGCVGILAGFAALAMTKGSDRHRQAGTVFVVSMLTMAGFAAVMAAMGAQRLNTLAALFTLYLVTTAWAAVRRPAGESGRFERWAALGALGIAVVAGGFGLQAASPAGIADGDPSSGDAPNIYVAVALLAVLAAALDLKVLRRGGLAGFERLRRHLWRMCLALFVAAGSFFFGQQDEFPAAIQGSPLLMIPPFAALGSLAFWMAKTRRWRTPRPARA